jgi:hypothetical protein
MAMLVEAIHQGAATLDPDAVRSFDDGVPSFEGNILSV